MLCIGSSECLMKNPEPVADQPWRKAIAMSIDEPNRWLAALIEGSLILAALYFTKRIKSFGVRTWWIAAAVGLGLGHLTTFAPEGGFRGPAWFAICSGL